MEKDDSNGNSFEIIEKPQNDKSVSESNVPVISNTSITTGNLLSNVAPPTNIPDFTIWTSVAAPLANTTLNTSNTRGVITDAPMLVNQFPNTQFSAAIPLSKGIPQEALVKRPPMEAEQVSSGGFFDFVKDALSSQVVTKMVEKAKNSVDSIITTLDPQMSEYIYSGDIKIVVTSEEQDIVSAIRDAAHSIFGKASIIGIKNTPSHQRQAVGLENGIKNIEETIAFSTQLNDTPVIGIENVLIKPGKNWHDVTLLILKDSHNEINLQILSQAIPVPVNRFLGPEVADIDVENKLSEYLKAIPCWQEEVSGVPRRDVINLAAKVLLKLYKDSLSPPTDEAQIK